MTTQAAVPVSSIPGAWLVDASGSLIFRHPDVPVELPALAGTSPCNTFIIHKGACWHVRLYAQNGDLLGIALPLPC